MPGTLLPASPVAGSIGSLRASDGAGRTSSRSRSAVQAGRRQTVSPSPAGAATPSKRNAVALASAPPMSLSLLALSHTAGHASSAAFLLS